MQQSETAGAHQELELPARVIPSVLASKLKGLYVKGYWGMAIAR